jgi:hypothetical protein
MGSVIWGVILGVVTSAMILIIVSLALPLGNDGADGDRPQAETSGS